MMDKKRENQYERTAFSWMRSIALATLVTIYYLKAGYFESNLLFYLITVCLILLLLAYNRKSKFLLCSTLIALILSYPFL